MALFYVYFFESSQSIIYNSFVPNGRKTYFCHITFTSSDMSYKIIILAAVFIVLVIILIVFFPRIITFLSRLFFGKYSVRYYNIHKRMTRKSPYRHCFKGDFINHLAGFKNVSNSLERYDTSSEIKFENIDFLTKYPRIIRHKKKPHCVSLQKEEFFDLKAFGFRDTRFSSSIQTNYYFLNKRFFMGEYLLKNPSEENIKEIAKLLQQKYLGKPTGEIKDFIIRGKNAVTILFENTGFNLSVKYFYDGDDTIRAKLDSYWEKMTTVPLERTTMRIEDEMKEKL